MPKRHSFLIYYFLLFVTHFIQMFNSKIVYKKTTPLYLSFILLYFNNPLKYCIHIYTVSRFIWFGFFFIFGFPFLIVLVFYIIHLYVIFCQLLFVRIFCCIFLHSILSPILHISIDLFVFFKFNCCFFG